MTIKYKSRVVRYDIITNRRWRTAAILKVENTQYFGRGSTDVH